MELKVGALGQAVPLVGCEPPAQIGILRRLDASRMGEREYVRPFGHTGRFR